MSALRFIAVLFRKNASVYLRQHLATLFPLILPSIIALFECSLGGWGGWGGGGGGGWGGGWGEGGW